MAYERLSETIGPCACGVGVVKLTWKEKDYPFMSGNIGPFNEQYVLDCASCASKYVVVERVDTPTLGARVHLVERAEAQRVSVMNESSRQARQSALASRRSLGAVRQLAERELAAELIRRSSSGKGTAGKHAILGPAFGMALDEFRARVGRSRATTYIPELVREYGAAAILRRLERVAKADQVEQAEADADAVDVPEETVVLPVAAHAVFATAP